MRKWIPLFIIVAVVIFTAGVYNRLPESMPVHWNARGEVDRYGSRFWSAFGLPAFLLIIWGVLRAVPYIDPRRANIEKFRDTYEELIIAIIGMVSLIHLATVGVALGWPISIGRVVPIAVGLLFVFLGNLLPRFRSNWFMGIRTPWTLSSDTVWTRTHRVGGYAFVAIGLLLVIAGAFGSPSWLAVAIGGTIAVAIGIILYSYLAWRAERGET
jgi:uncharacterized membrane protein